MPTLLQQRLLVQEVIVKAEFHIAETVRSRLIIEFVAKREEILEQVSRGELPPERLQDRLEEIDMMLEGLASQGLPN